MQILVDAGAFKWQCANKPLCRRCEVNRASWTDIGHSMGVTKQAARKRFVPKDPGAPDIDANEGFSRFTPRARQTVIAAHETAKVAGNDQVTPGHLVLGLLTEPKAFATEAMRAAGASAEDVSREATATLPPSVDDVPALIPYADNAKKALELTFREALRLGHNYIGPNTSSSPSWNSKPAPAP